MSMYRIARTNRFKKDYKKMQLRKNFDETEFVKVVKMLANGEILPKKYCNHLLEPKSERYMGVPYKARLVISIYKR